MRPYDVYSGQKSEAEEIVRASKLEWVVLRLGAVLSPDMGALPVTTDAMYFQAALPSDGRVQTVDVRDVAWAFAAATTADVAREILLIGGDDSHRLTYAEVTSGLVAALGLPGAMPPGRPGDPNSDDDWFVTDWMDTTRAQEALHFRGPNCGPNCRRSTDCCATRARSSPGLCEWSWRAGRRIGTHPVSTPTRGGKYVPNWASRYGIGPKRFQRRRFHARPTAVTRADQNCIW